jgi:methyl-accepting chemotaxis protein
MLVARGGFTLFNRRLVIQPISQSVAQLNAAGYETRAGAGQINAASQQLAQSASSQAASLEQASSALEQISGMTASNAEHARQAKSLTEATRVAAAPGRSERPG